MTAAAQVTVDSHVHLIPSSAANNASHSWLHPGHPLQRQWLLSDYLATSTEALSSGQDGFGTLKGFVYVETDRALGPPGSSASEERWKGPLEELAFLRRIVEGTLQKDEEVNGMQAKALLGIVLWAPVDQGPAVLEEYLEMAEHAAGASTWQRVKGFRYLVQGMTDRAAFTDLVLGRNFVECLRLLGKRDYTFDVGVDQRQGGVWQLEVFLDCIKRVRIDRTPDEYGTFVLSKALLMINVSMFMLTLADHLCKPDMMSPPRTAQQMAQFARWRACMEQFSSLDKVYMKLSGGFSELPQQEETAPWTSEQVVSRMEPWLQCTYNAFGPSKLMFGSDWPVCTIGGPGVRLSWASWHSAVASFIAGKGLSQASMDDVWYGTATKAYRLDL